MNRLEEIQLRMTTGRYGRTDRLDLEFLLGRLAACEQERDEANRLTKARKELNHRERWEYSAALKTEKARLAAYEEALQQIAGKRDNASFDPWAVGIAREALGAK